MLCPGCNNLTNHVKETEIPLNSDTALKKSNECKKEAQAMALRRWTPVRSSVATSPGVLSNPGLSYHLGLQGNGTSHQVPPSLLGVRSSDVPGEWQGDGALPEQQGRVCFLVGQDGNTFHLPRGKGRA